MLEAVILAGGRGERFWPLSRRACPKQFLRLFGDQSLLQATWSRLAQRLAPEAIRVVAGGDLQAAVRRDLPALGRECFVAEPVGRNTAPAIGVAAALGRRTGDPVQLVAPADHWIPDPTAFWRTVERAERVAQAADAPLVTLGVPITQPETGYGYIERGASRPEAEGAYAVARFHEKPDRETALRYAGDPRFYWNSGIFIWRASALLEELERHMPALAALVAPLADAADPQAAIDELLPQAESQSIDWGLLERSARVAVVAADFHWSDVGSWASWGEQAGGDPQGNAVHGEASLVDTRDCVVYADQGLIAALGVRDLVIVRAADATLVLDRQRSQDVRAILAALRSDPEAKRYL